MRVLSIADQVDSFVQKVIGSVLYMAASIALELLALLTGLLCMALVIVCYSALFQVLPHMTFEHLFFSNGWGVVEIIKRSQAYLEFLFVVIMLVAIPLILFPINASKKFYKDISNGLLPMVYVSIITLKIASDAIAIKDGWLIALSGVFPIVSYFVYKWLKGMKISSINLSIENKVDSYFNYMKSSLSVFICQRMEREQVFEVLLICMGECKVSEDIAESGYLQVSVICENSVGGIVKRSFRQDLFFVRLCISILILVSVAVSQL